MSIFTKQEFQAIAYKKANRKGYTTLNESRMFSQSTSKTSIFLSHSHYDKALVVQAKTFLKIWVFQFMWIGLMKQCLKKQMV